uniref:Uncharacterized protein n=1 Tax=Cacopsylla melanoneura TaxID=428564 RepID=A0A8D9BHM6_9HEMI
MRSKQKIKRQVQTTKFPFKEHIGTYLWGQYRIKVKELGFKLDFITDFFCSFPILFGEITLLQLHLSGIILSIKIKRGRKIREEIKFENQPLSLSYKIEFQTRFYHLFCCCSFPRLFGEITLLHLSGIILPIKIKKRTKNKREN